MEVQLSREESSVAMLIQSHEIACESLSDFVVNAAKAINSDDWQNDVCSFFGQSLGRHVKQRVQSGLLIKDIYALCKIIRCQIHDIARLCGERLATPRDKERLSLHVQGVETARNWTFHGKTISTREVCSSVCLLKTILAALCATQPEHSTVEDKLEKIFQQAAQLGKCSMNDKYKQTIPIDAVGRSLLSCSLTDFERKFVGFFSDEMGSGHAERSIFGNDFFDLMKKMRKAITKMASEKKLHGPKEQECMEMSKNILSARNALAHSGNLTLSTMKNCLSDIRNLFSAFNMSCEKTDSALNRFEVIIKGAQDGQHLCVCVEQATSRNGGSLDSFKDQQTILRPRARLFVGRREELNSIKQVLAEPNSPTRQRVVLLYGPAGIGKSYLAAELAHCFSNTYSRETWLSCASVFELEQDLSHQALLPKKSNALAKPHDDKNTSLSPFVEEGDSKRDHLMILDDVRTCTYQTVCDQFVKSDYTLIITTTSTVVKNCLQRDATQLYTAHLKPFTLAESWELLTLKTGKKREDEERKSLQEIDETFCGVLENLPLCVGIYSSLVGFEPKKKKTPERFDFGKSALRETWSDIERRFGDRLHVRGLTGVVECAERFLKDQPLSVFLLAKLCSANCETIPWKIVCSRHSQRWTAQGSRLVMEPWLGRLFSGLLGVFDWLFSDSGRTALEDCRSNLEELGLISWHSSTRIVSFHGLTFSSVKKMLKERYLFFGGLISAYCPRESETLAASSMIMTFISNNELLSDVLTEGVRVLQNTMSAETNDENSVLGGVFCVFQFLSKFVRTTECSPLALEHDDAFVIPRMLVPSVSVFLFKFADYFFLHVPLVDLITWHRSLDYLNKKIPRSENIITFHVFEATIFYSRGLGDKAATCLKAAQALLETSSDPNSADVARYHHVLGWMYGVLQGSEAKKLYMEKAFRSCSRLLTGPSHEDIKHALSSLKTLGYYRYQETIKALPTFFWSDLVCCRIEHSLETFGILDQPTLQTALLLIEFYQQVQVSIMKEIARDERKKVSSIRHYCSLATEVMNEGYLWDSLCRYGLSLRALVKVYLVLETCVLDKTIVAKHTLAKSELWSHLDSLLHCVIVRSWRVGHFSLGATFLRRCSDNWPQDIFSVSVESSQRPSDPQPGSPMAVFQRSISCLLPLVEALEDFFKMKNTETMLEKVLTSIHNTSKSFENESLSVRRSRILSPFAGVVVVWCSCLRYKSLSTALSTFEALSKSKEPQHEIKSTSKMMITCLRRIASPQWELTKLAQRYIDAKNSLEKNECTAARGKLLKCWEDLTHITEHNQFLNTMIQDDAKELLALATLIVVRLLFLNVAQLLQHIFVDEEEYDKAEYFANLRFESARNIKNSWPFIAINCYMDFVEFLKDRGRFSEALAQCRLVEQSLVEEFGEDYLEWLPDSPRARETLQALQN